MTEIIKATGLSGDKTYAVQVRGVFPDGSSTDWGPTFSLIKRTITGGVVLNDLGASQAGVNVSWSSLTPLDSAFGEQWLVKIFDYPVGTIPTDEEFDSSGIEIYRGSASQSVDYDINNITSVTFAVAKIDKFGNRSTIDSSNAKQTVFNRPDSAFAISTVNRGSKISIQFNHPSIDTPENSSKNRYAVVRVLYGDIFTHYKVTNAIRLSGKATIITDGDKPEIGKTVQVSTNTSFDGAFLVTGHVINGFTYDNPGSDTSLSIDGVVTPTDSGPSTEGSEIYRSEITAFTPDPLVIDYQPDVYGQTAYFAVGIEDEFKNLSTWSIVDSNSRFLSFGRNYIANRKSIIFPGTTSGAANANRTDNSYWKYGYCGWSNVHTAKVTSGTSSGTGSQLIIPTGSVNGLKIKSGIDSSNVEYISLGVQNGGTGTKVARPITGSVQSRTYSSQTETSSQPTVDSTSVPLIDDPYFVGAYDQNQDKNSKSLSDLWIEKYASEGGKGIVWLECSASDILDDKISTMDPIGLSGVSAISGSFTVTPETWGDGGDAKLKLYAVGGTWTSDDEGIYDPHFDPLGEQNVTESHARTVKSSHRIVSSSKSANTCTVTLATTRVYGHDEFGSPLEESVTRFPVAGDSITVSTGDSRMDGTFIIASTASNIILYNTTTADTVGTTTGSLVVNYSEKYTISNKARSGQTVTINISGDNFINVGDKVDVSTGDILIDGYNLNVTEVGGKSVDNQGGYIKYLLGGSSTVSSTPASGYVVVRQVPDAPSISEIEEWNIGNDPDDGLFSSGSPQVPLSKKFDWIWSTPSSYDISTIRLVWVLEFNNDITIDPGNYVVRLSEFEAWPGINNYADLSGSNVFSDEQKFLDGVSIRGPLEVWGGTTLRNDLIVEGEIADINHTDTDTLIVNDQFDVISNLASVAGSPIHTASTIYHYTDDYPRNTPATINATSGQVYTINSLSVKKLPVSNADSFLAIVNWSGVVRNVNAARTITFKLWWWGPNPKNGGTVEWYKIGHVGARGPEAGGSISKLMSGTTESLDGSESLGYGPRVAVTAEIDASDTFDIFSSGDEDQAGNILEIVYIPTNRSKGLAIASEGMFNSDVPTYGRRPNDTTEPGNRSKTALISLKSNNFDSYLGDGSSPDSNYVPDSGAPIKQGFLSSEKGNQKSAWFFENTTWSQVQGDTPVSAAATIADDVTIISCKLIITPNSWGPDNGGTAVIGTHNDSSGGKAFWSNIAGKNSDRKRQDWNGTATKTVDLPLSIGKEIWNGTARLSWQGAGGSMPKENTGAGNAHGLIFGPAPSTASKFYGSFKTNMEIQLKVQWKE